jgi:hypothetical protein
MSSLRAGHIEFREGIPERSLEFGSSLMQIFQERSQTPLIRRIRHRVGEDKRSRSTGEGGTDLRILLPLTGTSACWPGSQALPAACAIDQRADFRGTA